MDNSTTITVTFLVIAIIVFLIYYYSSKLKNILGLEKKPEKKRVSLPLDQVGIEPYVVYSFERMYSEYDGPLFQIFDGRNTKDVEFYDKNDPKDQKKYEGFPITIWYDQSGNGRDLIFPLPNIETSNTIGTPELQASVTRGGVSLTNHFTLEIPDSNDLTAKGKFTIIMSQMDSADVSSGYDEYCDLLKRGCFFIGGDLQNRIFSINDGTHN